jgi:UDP-glucose 4-epimerase
VVHRLTHPGCKFNIFLLTDNEDISTPEFVRRIGNALGKKSRVVPFPLFALKTLFRVIGRSEAAESVAGSLEVDVSKALETGWRPEISLDQGLRSALQASKLPA